MSIGNKNASEIERGKQKYVGKHVAVRKPKEVAKFNNVVRTTSKKINKENERILYMKNKPKTA